MNWENLNTQECPFCSKKIEDREGEMRCTKCSFHIEYRRYHQIRAVRSKNGQVIRMKWQYLKQGKCPMCEDLLKDSIGKYSVLRCINQDCPFKIREDALAAMLADSSHPVNKYDDTLSKEE